MPSVTRVHKKQARQAYSELYKQSENSGIQAGVLDGFELPER